MVDTQPHLLSSIFRKAGEHIQQIQNNLVIQQEVGKQGLETEKMLSK